MTKKPMRSQFDVVIVGAGVMGLAIGWRACQRGLSVCAVERDRPGAGASGVAAGMLAPVTEADFGEAELVELNLAGASRYPEFVSELESVAGLDTGYRPCGTLVVATDRDELDLIDRLHGLQSSLGLDATRLTSRETRSLEPSLSPRVVGGIDVPGDHQVRPRALVAALEAAFSASGGVLVKGTVERILSERNTVTATRLSSGEELECAQVVICAGAWSGSIGGIGREGVPSVRPVKGQILRLFGEMITSRVIRTPDVYAVPRADGTLVVGATVEEQGFDLSVTAGGVLEMLRRAYDVLPGVTELELVETSAGLRPTTPDNRPLVGRGQPDGLIWAGGHWRNGILLTPLTGEVVADLLTGATPSVELRSFGPDRAGAGVA